MNKEPQSLHYTVHTSLNLLLSCSTQIMKNLLLLALFSTIFQSKLFVVSGEDNDGALVDVFPQSAQAPTDVISHEQLILAKERTQRPDILRGFKKYNGGWNITNHHYWSRFRPLRFRNNYTSAPGFVPAVAWFIFFGIFLALYCCCWPNIQMEGTGLNGLRRTCLVMLLLFTCSSVIGSVLLSVDQDRFHKELLYTLEYIANQSDYTVGMLKNVTEYLSEAKGINVGQFSMPSTIQDKIKKLTEELSPTADKLEDKSSKIYSKLRKLFKFMQSVLIAVVAVMLSMTVLGLVLSLCGHRHAMYIFIFGGWLLVAVTFFLCGVSIILNNAITDTCLAMEEWVNDSQAETALSNILPCIDQRMTNNTLIQSKEVINTVVTIVNLAIEYSAYKGQFPINYNQSEIPLLCPPFDSKFNDYTCGPREVSFANASSVWQNYMCTESTSGFCNSTGKITPETYLQLVAAVRVSSALYQYAPPLLSLQDCGFVKQTFQTITSYYCLPLEHDVHMVVTELFIISVGVAICLILWIVYSNLIQGDEAFMKN